MTMTMIPTTIPAPALDALPVDWSALAPDVDVLVVAVEPVEALGIRPGDALEVRRCAGPTTDDGGPCVVTVASDSMPGDYHLDGDGLGVVRGSDEALLFGAVEDPRDVLEVVRARWAESRSAWIEERAKVVAKVEETDRLRERVTHYRDDVERIGSALKDAAEAENLCSQYDDAVEEVVETLMVAGDVFRESARVRRDYVVTVPVVVEVPVAVTAEDEETAREEASSSWRDWLTGDEDVSTGSPDLSDVEEWHAEEVER